MKIQIIFPGLLLMMAAELYAAAPEINFSKLASQPDNVLINIATNLPDNDLISFSQTSRRLREIAIQIIKERPWLMWKISPINQFVISHAHEGQIVDVFVTTKKNIVSVGKQDKLIKIWEADTRAETRHIDDTAASPIVKSRFSLSTDIIALYHPNDIFTVFNIQTAKIINQLNSEMVFDFAISPDGTTLAVGHDGEIDLLNIQKGTKKTITSQMIGHSEIIWSLAFSPDSSAIAAAPLRDQPVTVWNVNTLVKEAEFKKRSGSHLSYLPDGKLIARKGDGHYIEVRNVATTARIAWLHFSDNLGSEITAATLSQDGRLVAAGSKDKIRIYSLRSSEIMHEIKNDKSFAITSLSFSPDDTMLVAGCDDGSIVIWQAELSEKK